MATMAEHSSIADDIVVHEAKMTDLDSLMSIIPRAFTPSRFMPDTPSMRDWWRRVYEEYIRVPARYVFVAANESTNAVIGMMTLRGVKQGERFGGFFPDHPATPDHDPDMWPIAIEIFRKDEEKICGDRDRLLLEMLGVDRAYQRKGIGRKLVGKACDIADAHGCPIFLETGRARAFYLNQERGFEAILVPDEETGELRPGEALIREPPQNKTAL